MFRGFTGFVIAAIVIPMIQFMIVLLAMSGLQIPASPAGGYVLFATFIFAKLLVIFMVIINLFLWIIFKIIKNFWVNALIAAVIPMVPALLGGDPAFFVVVYTFFFSGYISIAVLVAYGRTGRGLAYDLGVKIAE